MRTSAFLLLSSAASFAFAAVISTDTKIVRMPSIMSDDSASVRVVIPSGEGAPHFSLDSEYLVKRAETEDAFISARNEINATITQMKSYVSEEGFKWSLFFFIGKNIGESLYRVKNSLTSDNVPDSLKKSLSLAQNTFSEMTTAAATMNQWNSRKTPGSAEIVKAYEIIVICLLKRDMDGHIDSSVSKEEAQEIYESAWEVARSSYRLQDKQNMDVLTPVVQKALQLSLQLSREAV